MPTFGLLAQTGGTGQQVTVRVTCYAPGADPVLEGPFATSKPGPNGGQSIPRTLDDFRLGRSNYVTLAANPARYGQWFDMGTITYVSNIDNRQYTIQKVVGYVHDTGCAFKTQGERGACCAKYNTCGEAVRKMDIAYGDFRSGRNVGLVNSGPVCGNVLTIWTQIGGPLNVQPNVTAGPYVNTYSPSIATPGPGSAGYTFQTGYPANNTGFPSATGYSANNIGYPTTIGSQQSFNSQQSAPAISSSLTSQPVSLEPYNPNMSPPVKGGASVSHLVVWPKTIKRGATLSVIWTSVNMTKDSCQVLFAGQEFAKANEGSKPLKTATSDSAMLTFTLRCQDSQGQYKETSDSAMILQ